MTKDFCVAASASEGNGRDKRSARLVVSLSEMPCDDCQLLDTLHSKTNRHLLLKIISMFSGPDRVPAINELLSDS